MGSRLDKRRASSDFTTGTFTTDTTARQLPDRPGQRIVLQADPGNSVNIVFGGASSQDLILAPGASWDAALNNLNLVWVSSSTSGQKLHWGVS